MEPTKTTSVLTFDFFNKSENIFCIIFIMATQLISCLNYSKNSLNFQMTFHQSSQTFRNSSICIQHHAFTHSHMHLLSLIYFIHRLAAHRNCLFLLIDVDLVLIGSQRVLIEKSVFHWQLCPRIFVKGIILNMRNIVFWNLQWIYWRNLMISIV